MTAALDLHTVARALGGEVRGGEVLCAGPGHSEGDRSLSIRPDKDDPEGFVTHSFSGDDWQECRAYVRTKLGLPEFKKDGKKNGGKTWTVISEHIYYDEHGERFLKVRKCLDPNGKKQYPQLHWDGNGWAKGKRKGPKIPYRLPQLLAAPVTATVYFCEGEKDADNLTKQNFVATTASEGAAVKWAPELTKYFKDRHVVVLPDADEPGRKHAQKVAKAINGVAASLKVIDLFPERNDGSDVSNWLETDRVGAKFIKTCKEAPYWEAGASHSDTSDSSDDTSTKSDDELIAELAALPPLQYAKRRKDAAEKIGIGVGELDKIVAAARGEPEPEAFDERWLVELWDEPVTTAELLTDLHDVYAKYVILPEHGTTAMALWNLHAWTIEASYVSPFIMFTSPTPRCGKTVGMALLLRTGPRTILTSNISAAAIFRFIEAHHPTLIIDEADSFIRDNEDMRGILNSGHTRDGAFVVRCEGDDNEPRKFSTWAPKAVAGIGKLAATLRDRAIILRMKRKRPGEQVTKLRVQDTDIFVTLRRKAARWASDNLNALRGAQPKIPDALNDRAQDNWEPLFAIADLAGADWPKMARVAAVALSKENDGEADPSQLLADIRDVFTARDLERVTTKYLIAQLAEDETKPWGSFTKDGKPITPERLARLLREFEIKPRTLRVGEDRGKGYLRLQFQDAWERYVPVSPLSQGSQPVTPCQSSEINDLEPIQPVTSDIDVTGSSAGNPLKKNHCHGVTGSAPQTSERESKGPDASPHVCAQCHGPVDGKEQRCCIDGVTVWLHPECQRFYEGGYR
jgi:Protein of unknown function (DUF3631)